MWTINVKSITITILVSIAWWFGFRELWAVLSNFGQQWFWFVLATIYTSTLNDTFGHMILTHRLFKVNVDSLAYKIMSFLFIVDHGWGPVTSFCMAHTRHHTHSDQGNKDVANAFIHWYGLGMSTPLNFLYQAETDWGNPEKYIQEQNKKYKEIFDDTWTFFVEEYSHIITILFWLLLYLVAPIILFKIIFMGRALLSIYTLFSSIFGHSWVPGGYRRFPTNDRSHNNLLLHYISCMMFPTILQNNHHGVPYSLEKGSAVKWYEYDISKWFARLLKIYMEKK